MRPRGCRVVVGYERLVRHSKLDAQVCECEDAI